LATNDELAAQIAGLSSRVRRTEDILAIYELKARYGELVDDRYVRGAVVDEERLYAISNEIAALFTRDAVWNGGPGLGTAVGREAIADQMRRTTLVFSRHLFVKPRIRLEGDRARGRWDLLCPCKSADGTSLWMCGYEDDEYARAEDGLWLHQSMRLTTVFYSATDTGFEEIFK
jgi:hypothetical protein